MRECVICAKMKTILSILFCFHVVNLPFVKSDCGWDFKSVNIKDTDIDKIIFESGIIDDFTFQSWSVTLADGGLNKAEALKYFTHDDKENSFTLSTTKYFGSLNNDAYTGKDVLTINIVVKLECDGKSTENIIYISITNTNQNAPIFSQDKYSYSLPMPIMPKTDISLFGDEITATDIDFSTNRITFKVEPEDFNITTVHVENKKFRAVFSANKILRFTDQMVYKLIANDSGTPPQTTSVTVTITVDSVAGLDSPRFSNAYYSYNYTSATPPTLTPTSGGIISIESDKSDEAQISLNGEHADLFKLTYINKTKSFTVEPRSDATWPEDESNQIILTLTFTTDATANAIILISAANDDSKPSFSSEYYIGTYDIGTNTISLDGQIEVIGAISVAISGEKSDLFTVDQKTYVVSPSRQLSRSDFNDNSYILLNLTASSDTSEAHSIIFIMLPNTSSDELRFNSTFYRGVYSVKDGDGEVSLENGIGFRDVTDFGGITIEVDKDYRENFNIEIDTTANFIVSVKSILSLTVLDANTELSIPITATKEGEAETSAILILKLPEKVEIKFSKTSYIGQYIQESDSEAAQVIMNENILIEGASGDEVDLTVDDYDDYLELKYDEKSSTCKVNIKKPLDATVIDKNTELIITITASSVCGTSTGNTVLVLKLPSNSSTLQFKNKHYAAEYKVESKSQASVEYLGDGINIDGDAPTDLQFTFEDYDDYFELKHDESSSMYLVNVKKPLDATVLDKNTELIITITASSVSGSSTGNTVLVLKLPSNTSTLQFKYKHYAAEYKVDSASKASVEYLGDGINIDGDVATDLQFTFEDYDDYFELKYDESSSMYVVNVKKPLDATVLDKNTELIITITASSVSGSSTGNTVLVLKLPSNTSTLQFKNKHYSAEYKVDSKSQASVEYLGDGINIDGDAPTDLQFTFEDYDDYFELKHDESSSMYLFNVKKPLDATVLDKNTELIITITASSVSGSTTGNTVLVLKLPSITSTLQFKYKHYAAEYKVDAESKASVEYLGDGINIDGDVATDLQFTFEDYDDYFELKYDESSSTYVVNVKKPLDATVLDKNTELIITITASSVSGSSTGNTVLVLKLPSNTSTLQFKNKHYAAEYKVVSESKASVEYLGDGINIDGDVATDLQFTFEDYDDYFELKYDENSSTYVVNVKKPLDATVLDKNTELIITITASSVSGSSTGSTVLVLKLPSNTSTLQFKNKHYAAEYKVDSESKASVEYLGDGINIDGDVATDLQFTFEDYDDYFELKYDESSSTYVVNVKKPLDATVLDKNTELIITITASSVSGSSTGNTVLVLKLSSNTSTLQFKNKHYAAEYKVDSESKASVEYLGDGINIDGDVATDLQFTFEDYDDYFELKYDESTSMYIINVRKPLEAAVVGSNTELIITITASTRKGGSTGSTVLSLRLPVLKFNREHYTGIYSVESQDTQTVVLDTDIVISNNDPSNIKLVLEGYEDNFAGTCSSSTLKCEITVTKKLNDSTLSDNYQLLITLIGRSTDGSNNGKSVLLLKLPQKDSTFNFTQQYYSATYAIQNSDEELASVELKDEINFDGADPSELTVILDQYSDKFSISFDSKKWNLMVVKNLDSDILSNNAELVISLTAKRGEKSDYSKATLAIKLPDKTTFTFLNVHYSGTYETDDEGGAEVELTGKEIQTTSTNVHITLDDYNNNFEVVLDSKSKWTIKVNKLLDSSLFSEQAELKLLMTVTKAGVKYGEAALIIKLPDPVFSKGFYVADYSDEDATIKLNDQIEVHNVNAEDILITLSLYKPYFQVDFDGTNWVLKITEELPANITQNNAILLTDLSAVRATDKTQLATSTLIVRLPNHNTTGAPQFSDFTFYGYYNNITSLVELSNNITFNNLQSVKLATVSIEDKCTYAENFEVEKKSDNIYEISVKKKLSSDVLNSQSSIVCTLVGTSTEGVKGYAALVINLPKTTREKSVDFEDEDEILYTGTYDNGTFTSPVIPLQTASTDIDVVITSDLIEDKKYFKYEYANKQLTIQVDKLPNDILKKHPIIPLKLAITDKTTGDTVHAVLNIEIKDSSGGDSQDTADSVHTGLLVAVIILACLLVGAIAATILLWYFKIRGNLYNKMDEEMEQPTKKPELFTRNLKRQNSAPVPNDSLRRPTGLPIGVIRSDSPTEDTSSDFEVQISSSPTLNMEKKVGFDDNLPNMHVYDGEENYESLKNVAVRRPTQFIFTPSVPDEDTPERRESSDYIGTDTEKKKAVVFDEKVQRMQIDVDDDSDDAVSDESEDDDENAEANEVVKDD